MPARDAEVIIVGAGMAGLACARRLTRAGRSVLVLEARGRPGGRVLEHTLDDGQALELGGQSLGPGQTRALALAAEYELGLYPTHTAGANLLETARGDLVKYTGTTPKLRPHVLADVAQAQWRLDRMARRIDPLAPWSAPRADALDSETLASWIRRHVHTEQARQLMHLACVAVLSAEPADLSVLHLLFYIRSAGGLGRLLDTDDGAQQWRVRGGTARLAARMAAELGELLLFDQPVSRVDWTPAAATVHTERSTFRAARVVMAMPPALAGRIRFHPGLPTARDSLTQRFAMGSVIKCMAIYDRPFWRVEGMSGNATSLRGPVRVVFDNTPDTGRPGVLLAFLEGHDARLLSDAEPDVRVAAVTSVLGRLFGAQATSPEAFVEHDWSADVWSRGGYAGVPSPGTWTSVGHALREPVGPLHWAGTETATVWSGYIDGAIRSGERAAGELL